mgnify:FL=1
MYYLICLLIFIIVILIVFILEQNKKYNVQIFNKNKQLSNVISEIDYYKNECINLKKIIEINKPIELKNISKNDLTYEPLYEGKKALIGDYFSPSYNNTKKVLESLGFDVTVALSGKEILKRIKEKEKYDIIFSNNIYQNGTGEECLKELKKIENFNIPVVVHTITQNARDKFVNEIGFDDYIEKPVTKEKIKPVLKRLINN